MGTNGAGLSVLWTAIGNSDRPSHPTDTTHSSSLTSMRKLSI